MECPTASNGFHYWVPLKGSLAYGKKSIYCVHCFISKESYLEQSNATLKEEVERLRKALECIAGEDNGENHKNCPHCDARKALEGK